jgi:hypothetical protein
VTATCSELTDKPLDLLPRAPPARFYFFGFRHPTHFSKFRREMVGGLVRRILCIMPSQMDLTPSGVARLRIILSRVRCLVASPVQATLTRSKSEFFTPYPGRCNLRISETSLKDVALMTIEEIKNNGGVMGRKI